MEFIIINHYELSALNGLPYLQQLIYIRGLTGLIGLRRGISYQSLSEALYIEPHSGIKSGSPSKDQLRRALKGLEKAGLIELKSWERKLVFRCLLLNKDESRPNKPATNPPQLPASNTIVNSRKSELLHMETDAPPRTEPTIPQNNNNNNYFYIFLLPAFEKFWDLYPLKKEKENALEVFKKLKPSENLANEILTRLAEQIQSYHQKQLAGIWVPAWKYPANWLAQRCWEITSIKEPDHAIHERNCKSQTNVHPIGIKYSSEDTSFSDAEFQKLWSQH